jgi:branched-chain amino acid transport system permease protein
MDITNLIHYGLFFLSMAGIFAILTLGLNLQWGLTGLFNLGVAGFFAIGAYSAAILCSPPNPDFLGGYDLPLVVGAIGAMFFSAIIAVLIGLATIRLRTDYLAIATIGIAEIIRLLVKNEEWLTNGVRGIAGIPRPFGFGSPELFLLLILAVVGVVYFLAERARISPWGRVMRALRENEDGAIAAGKNVNRYRLQAFTVGSAFMGLAGALYAYFVGFVSPEAFKPLYGTFLIWVMLIAGGSGNNLGALIGALGIWIIWSGTQVLTDILPAAYATQAGAVRVLLIGVLLQVVLLTRPQGVLPERQPRLPARLDKADSAPEDELESSD